MVAVFGIAGILAAGGGWIGMTSPPSPALPAPTIPVIDQSSDWITRLNATLTSIDEQLDVITQAEDVWNNSDTPHRYAGHELPPQVSAMLERKALLEGQRAALNSQMSTWDALDRTAQELAETEHQLTAVEEALATAPTGDNLSEDQATVIHALSAQRDLLKQRRDDQRDALNRLEQAIEDAQSGPLPEPIDRATPIAESVLALMEAPPPEPSDDGPTPSDDGPTPQPSLVIAGGRENNSDRPRQDYTTGEPADPLDEPIPERSGLGPDGKSTSSQGDPISRVGNIVDDTADVLPSIFFDHDNGGGRDHEGRGNGRGNAAPDSDPPEGSIDDLLDVVESGPDASGFRDRSAPSGREPGPLDNPVNELLRPAPGGPNSDGTLTETLEQIADAANSANSTNVNPAGTETVEDDAGSGFRGSPSGNNEDLTPSRDGNLNELDPSNPANALSGPSRPEWPTADGDDGAGSDDRVDGGLDLDSFAAPAPVEVTETDDIGEWSSGESGWSDSPGSSDDENAASGSGAADSPEDASDSGPDASWDANWDDSDDDSNDSDAIYSSDGGSGSWGSDDEDSGGGSKD